MQRESKAVISEERKQEIKENTQLPAGGFRGIKDDTYKYFGVRHEVDAEGNVLAQYCPVTQEGELTGYKVREIPKNFHSEGRVGADCDMFMSFRFQRGGKYVLITEGECLLPSTEVLTKNGWVSLQDYNESHGEVMQGNGQWALPSSKIYKQYSGDLIKYRSGSYQLTMTPEHNMVRLDANGNKFKCKASDEKKKSFRIPRTISQGGLDTSFFDRVSDSLYARLQVMLSADFTFRSGGDLYARFKKERKIARCEEILLATKVRYVRTSGSDGYTNFFIHRGHGFNVGKLFNYERDLPCARTILEELLYWDGNSVPNRNQIEYSSKELHNAKFIQTCAHLCGYTSTIIPRSNRYGNWYKVSILFGKQTSSTQQGYTEESYSGYVACLTVEDGTLLVKENNSISVTGNCDALSAWQMLKEYNVSRGSDFETAVVSPTTGANSSRQIANNYDFFNSFEQIILGFDNDKAGQAAIEDVIKVLPKGKVKIMHMRYKDANEYIKNDTTKAFISDFYDAQPHVPVGVIGSGQISQSMRALFDIPKIPLPPFMSGLQDMLADGIPLGCIVNLVSASGAGKSTFVEECKYYWIFHCPHLLGTVTLESTKEQYGIKLLSRHIGKKIFALSNEVAKELLAQKDIIEKEKDLFYLPDGSHRFFLVDNRDGSVEDIKSAIENLIISCGCKVIVLDPIHDIIASLPREEQDNFVTWLKGMVKSHVVTFINVCHTRKTQGSQKAGSTGADLHEEDIMGSSALYKSASINLVFNRNKEAEDPIERNTTVLKLTKSRDVGVTGIAGVYYYDNSTHTVHDKNAYFGGGI